MRDRRRVAQFAPITLWLPECSWKTARADILAGVAVAGLLIPEGIQFVICSTEAAF
jgi:sulfate permease, SulP family